MKPWIIILPLALSVLPAPVQAEPPAGYRLVWADEFTHGTLPDPARWDYDTEANATGWYNHELQYYAAGRPQNAAIADGKLVITARKERLSQYSDYGGQDYSSARLITRGRFEFTYGYVEARAKLPCGQGLWPAIWTLGATAPWPKGGEIDIMEHVNSERVVHGTLHTQSTAGTAGSGGSARVTDLCGLYHTYQMDWTASAIRIGVDGRYYHSYPNRNKGADQWPFDAPHYLLVNLAVGGDWPGDPDDGVFPAEFFLDYVRVYQRP